MSNEKKVWLGFVGGNSSLKTYSIQVSFTTLRYTEMFNIEQQIAKIKDKEQKEILVKELNKLFDIGIKMRQDYASYEPLKELPDSGWLKQKPLPAKSAYLFFITNGYLLINQACADVLKNFNLGKTTLTPLQIHDPKTQDVLSDETYYFINVAERREFVKKEQSNETLKYDEFFEKWSYKPNHVLIDSYSKDKKNYPVDIDMSATDCELDLWADAHLKNNLYFMSDRLRNALVEAKLDKLWSIHLCDLV